MYVYILFGVRDVVEIDVCYNVVWLIGDWVVGLWDKCYIFSWDDGEFDVFGFFFVFFWNILGNF